LRSRHLRLVPRIVARPPPAGAAIVLRRREAGRDPEGYGLSIGAGRAEISASARAGYYYGAVSLWQMMTGAPGTGAVSLAPVRIDDSPRFPWRGLLVDSARHFQTVAQLERLIDWMSLHKLNVLEWHLTDDQAWRLEVPAYPRLTAIGAWRVPASVGPPPKDPKTGRAALYGGFYTRAQVRALVAFAAARNVTIVPEIEMPGHAVAALLSYPQLSSAAPPPRSIQSDWGVFPYAFGIDEEDFGFLQTVLAEVVDLFPGPFVAVGGDEVVSDAWIGSPKVQARMRSLGIADGPTLHAWFFQRIGDFLAAHGRRMIGWDEILEGARMPNADAITSWHGGLAALGAIETGHDVVMAVSPTLYFDHRQSDLATEPPGRGDVVSLADVYAFDPDLPPIAPPTQPRGRVLGVEGALWTEHIATFDRLQAMAFPRAAALAEVGWTAVGRRDWRDFLARLPGEAARFAALGLAEDQSALAVKATLAPDEGSGVTVTLANQAAFGDIRYSTGDGSATTSATLYRAPLHADLPGRLSAATFDGERRVSPLLQTSLTALSVRRKASQELAGCTNKVTLNLEGSSGPSGPRPVYLVDVMNPCWIWLAADLTGVGALAVGVGRLPFNFQIGADRARIVLHPPATPQGELEVHLDGCDRPLLAVLPLATAADRQGPPTLTASLASQVGRHDLCFFFTSARLDPFWALDFVQLMPVAAH
jgi:hexosaminidase